MLPLCKGRSRTTSNQRKRKGLHISQLRRRQNGQLRTGRLACSGLDAIDGPVRHSDAMTISRWSWHPLGWSFCASRETRF